MGILRVYLALCVVSTHASSGSILPWAMHDGRSAVQIFFIISGFYMAMVLSNGYTSIKEFYTSRCLRIFVPYYSTLVFIVVISALAGAISGHWLLLEPYASHPFQHNGATGVVFTAVSNLTLFFQDWVMLLQQDLGQPLSINLDLWRNKVPLYHYLLVPQCWSVALELTFYLLVPYINRLKTRNLLFVLACSLVARWGCYHFFALYTDPWNYRFFPFELANFIFGMLGWRFYNKYDLGKAIPNFTKKSGFAVCAAVVLALMFLHLQFIRKMSEVVGHEYAILLGYPIFIVFIPVLFAFSRRSSIDRYIGELSYPIYLLHIILIPISGILLKATHLPITFLGRTGAVLTIIVSLLMFHWLVQPFEKWRHRFITEMAARREGQVETAVAV